MKIKEVIIVEGKNDTKNLKQYFDCETIETHGTCLSKYTLKMIKKMQATRGVILFLDPDSPGEKIRNQINQAIPGCKNAFIERKKARTDKKVGVEHAKKDDLIAALSNCMTYDKTITQEITMQDMYQLHLMGHELSSYLRERIGNYYCVGKTNAKTLLQRLNMLHLTKEELERRVNYEKTNCHMQ